MPLAGDPFLNGLALPLSHNPLQRLEYTSQMPHLDAKRLEEAQEEAITAFLTLLKAQTGLDLVPAWENSLAIKHANQAFGQALQNAITNYQNWNSFFAQVSTAWNTWIATVTELSLSQLPDLQDLLSSLFGVNPNTGGNFGAELNNVRQRRKAQNDVIINDWFHQTYPIGTYTDTATTLVGGKRTWWGAWNDNLHLLGEILGIVAPTDAASDVGTATQVAQSTANTGVTNAGLASSKADQVKAWAARKAQNDRILGDWLHTTYPIGSLSDTAATLVGGKRTYWGAWNDNLLIIAEQLGIATPTDPLVDIGTQVSSNTTAAASAQATANTGVTNAGLAQTTANGATTKANQNAAWAARKAQNDKILGDWLHATYPLGSTSDTAATLVGGKRTYWGAWNDNLLIIAEQLGIATPSDPLVDIGTQTQANTAAANTAASNATLAATKAQGITDAVANAAGQAGTNNTTTAAGTALTAAIGSSQFRQYSTDSSASNPSAAGTVTNYPISLTENDYNVGGYTFNSSTNTLTVPKKGLYFIKMAIGVRSTSVQSAISTLVLRRNGATARYGNSSVVTINPANNAAGPVIGDAFTVYLNAGDTIAPAMIVNSTTTSFKGDSGGFMAYLEVVLVRGDNS